MVPKSYSRVALSLLVLLWCASGSGSAQAAVEIKASVNRTEVPLDGTLRLTISVAVPDQLGVEHLELPDTGSLEILSTSREESMSFSFSGGKRQFNKATNTILTLRPSKKGQVTIGPAQLKYKGRVYKTKPIRVEVTDKVGRAQASGPTSPFGRRLPRGFPDDDWFWSPQGDRRRPEPVGEKDIFIRAYATPDLVVEGQQITVTVVVYSRVGARIAGIRWPKLDGFYSLDRDVSKVPTEEKYLDGVRYQYKVLARRALFPLRPGEITIEPMEVEVEASTSPFFPADSRTLRSQAIRIKVEALPEGAPAQFRSSNVGRFSLSGEVDATVVNLNQPITYTLTVRGSGNIQQLRPPELPALDKFKVFDPTVDVQVTSRGRAVKGSKTFEYILLPLASGQLTIPALAFSYYDPELGQYKTLSTQPQSITVQAADGQQANGGVGREVNVVSGAFKPIRFDSELRGYGPPFYHRPAFVPILAVPPLAYLLVLLIGFVRNLLQTDSPRGRMRKAWLEARRHLKTAGRAAASGEATLVFAELKEALLAAVESCTGRPAQGLQQADLRVQLQELNIHPGTIDALVREIENCDFGRFAPAESRDREMSAARERVAAVLRAMQRSRP